MHMGYFLYTTTIVLLVLLLLSLPLVFCISGIFVVSIPTMIVVIDTSIQLSFYVLSSHYILYIHAYISGRTSNNTV